MFNSLGNWWVKCYCLNDALGLKSIHECAVTVLLQAIVEFRILINIESWSERSSEIIVLLVGLLASYSHSLRVSVSDSWDANSPHSRSSEARWPSKPQPTKTRVQIRAIGHFHLLQTCGTFEQQILEPPHLDWRHIFSSALLTAFLPYHFPTEYHSTVLLLLLMLVFCPSKLIALHFHLVTVLYITLITLALIVALGAYLQFNLWTNTLWNTLVRFVWFSSAKSIRVASMVVCFSE